MQERTSYGGHVCAYTCKDPRGRHMHAKLPRYVCISVAERPFLAAVPLGSAYKVTSRVRAALTVCEPVPLRVFEGNAEKWADVSFGGCQCAGTPTCATLCGTHVSSVRTRV